MRPGRRLKLRRALTAKGLARKHGEMRSVLKCRYRYGCEAWRRLVVAIVECDAREQER